MVKIIICISARSIFSGFHQHCHVPPVEGSIVTSPWFCRRCVFALAVRVHAFTLSGSLLVPCQLLKTGTWMSTWIHQCHCNCLHTERWSSEERSTLQNFMGYETSVTLQGGESGLGFAAPNQSAAVLLLLWRPGRVSSINRAAHFLSDHRLTLSLSLTLSVCIQVVSEDAAVFSVSAVVPWGVHTVSAVLHDVWRQVSHFHYCFFLLVLCSLVILMFYFQVLLVPVCSVQ